MDRPSAPRRKSSASENEEAGTKSRDPKTHRKSFVVGNKSHHNRVPSYGKKLNQLGKLTALTTSDNKVTSDNTTTGSPRRASIHRSVSQKSLTEARSSRRNGSTHDMRKLQRSSSHHGSTTRLTGLKAMTKVEVHVEPDSHETTEDETQKDLANTRPVVKRPTFVIDDDEEEVDDEDEVNADSAAVIQKLSLQEPAENDPHNPEDLVHVVQLNGSHAVSGPVQDQDQSSCLYPEQAVGNTPEHNDTGAASRQSTSGADPVIRRSSGSGLLYHTHASPAGPQLSTEAVVSRDIQVKDRPLTGRSSTLLNVSITPANSHPLTSRFLESPRRVSAAQTQMASVGAPKDADPMTQPAAYKPSFYHQSPHGSTTNLGGGASRTQQKLLLQRASSIHFDAITDPKDESKQNGIRPRGTKEVDRIAREYKNVKRYRNPLRELTLRLYAKGLGMPNAQPLRRTMTQVALTNDTGDLRSSKANKSSANLGQQQQQLQPGPVQPEPAIKSLSQIDAILADLWEMKDDEADYQ